MADVARRASFVILCGFLFVCNRGADTGTTPDAPDATDTDGARRAAVSAELALYDTRALTFDASSLSEQDQHLLRALVRAAHLIEELNMLQVHPDNLDWYTTVQNSGSDEDRELYRRYQMPWCHDDDSPTCTAYAGAPPRQVGAYHWPEGMTEQELQAMGDAPNSRELLSPYTVVRRSGEGAWRAIPYSQDPLFGPRMAQVAEALREAATHADTDSLRTYLTSRADAFVADDPFPWETSDYHWIAIESRWEVTVGPYEDYRNPHNTKARFEMYVGIQDPAVTAATAPFREDLQDMENALAELVGDVYEPRALAQEGIAVRAVQVVIASGDARNPAGATIAYHLPNQGASVDEGLYKKVILVNHFEIFTPIMEARARLALDDDQAPLAREEESILGTAFHEFAHGIGSYDDMEITVDGAQTRVAQALGAYTTIFEEEKADIVGLWLMERQRAAGVVDDDQAGRWYVTHFMHLLGLLQYPLAGTYPRMVALQLGFFMDQGAVSYDDETGRFRVNLERMPAATEALARQVATIQLTGDRGAAEELLGTYVIDEGEGSYRLSDLLATPVQTVSDRFEQAGVRSVNLRYDITGL